MRYLLNSFIPLFVLFISSFAYAEDVDINTFGPAPYGNYSGFAGGGGPALEVAENANLGTGGGMTTLTANSANALGFVAIGALLPEVDGQPQQAPFSVKGASADNTTAIVRGVTSGVWLGSTLNVIGSVEGRSTNINDHLLALNAVPGSFQPVGIGNLFTAANPNAAPSPAPLNVDLHVGGLIGIKRPAIGGIPADNQPGQLEFKYNAGDQNYYAVYAP